MAHRVSLVGGTRGIVTLRVGPPTPTLVPFPARRAGARPVCGHPDVGIPWNDWPEKRIGPAERYGLLLKPTKPGVYPVTFTFHHWVSQKPVGFVRTQVTVA